jgi:hypothetical protein
MTTSRQAGQGTRWIRPMEFSPKEKPMKRVCRWRGQTFGVALGRSQGRANPAHSGAPRVIRASTEDSRLTTRWFRWGRVWWVRP